MTKRRRYGRVGLLWPVLAALGCAQVLGADFEQVHPRPAPDGASAKGGGGAADHGGATSLPEGTSGHGEVAELAGGAAIGEQAGAAGKSAVAGQGGSSNEIPGCPEPVHVELLPPPADGGPSAAALARSLGVIEPTDLHSRCGGVLVTPWRFMTIGCLPEPGDVIKFRSQLHATPPPGEPGAWPYEIASVSGWDRVYFSAPVEHVPYWDRVPLVSWEARMPLPGEQLTVIGFQGDGLARAFRTELNASQLDDQLNDVEEPIEPSFVFGADGKLLGFCVFDACGEPTVCRSSLWALSLGEARKAYSMQGARFPDWTGEGVADVAIENEATISFRGSDGTTFDGPANWEQLLDEPVRETLLANFVRAPGSGPVDMVTIYGDRITLRRGTGSVFEAEELWAGDTFPRTSYARTLVGDVDRQFGADLLMVSYADTDSTIIVVRSGDDAFQEPEVWHTGPLERTSIHLEDVTGDGKADLIVVRDDELEVLHSTGDSFVFDKVWLQAWPPGPPGWFFADVTGDGTADAIALGRGSFRVYPSNTEQFNEPVTPFLGSLVVGEIQNHFADVNGDGRADSIAIDINQTSVGLATGTGFRRQQVWADYQLWGAH